VKAQFKAVPSFALKSKGKDMDNTKNPSAWAKSIPQTFADLAFADDYTRQDLYDYVQYKQLCGNIILEGGYGSGKSTIAAIIAKERLGNTVSVYEINGEAWTEETVKTLRGTFNLARTCDEIPIVIINEVDRLKAKQFERWDFLDEHAQRLLVIMTTNHLANIDGSIVDRSDVFRERGFEAPVREHLRQQRPFLGICVGLQLLMEGSAEAPEVAGLGILPGRVERFNDRSVSTPHMGWNELEAWGETPLLAGVEAGAHAYFAHSFYVAFDQGATSRATGGAWSQHGHTRFLSAVSLGQLHATQFHPEKSQALGLSILRNFALAAQTAAASAHADG
jgi:imidazole glycerol phosphate synthase glutamine amidotransferase subunit